MYFDCPAEEDWGRRQKDEQSESSYNHSDRRRGSWSPSLKCSRCSEALSYLALKFSARPELVQLSHQGSTTSHKGREEIDP
jgi:hypothetical protein